MRKPRIVVSDVDYVRLSRLARATHAGDLMARLDRAEVVSAAVIAHSVVQMGSTVVFETGDGKPRRLTLAFPGQAGGADDKVSVMTPIGTALIGLSQGEAMSWAAGDGSQQNLTVLGVESPFVLLEA
jgi:regulator of nucleoside diphosphate kinase